MKTLLLGMLAILLTISYVQPGEMTGAGSALNVLSQNNLSVAALEGQGLRVLLGEVTGLGKKVSLDRVAHIITKKNIFLVSDANHVEFKYPSAAKTLEDIQYLEFDNAKVGLGQITGITFR